MKIKFLSTRGLFLQVILALSLVLGLAMISMTAQAGSPPPVAVNAGDDQTVTAGSLVTLQGSASLPAYVGKITYTWSQTGGATNVDLSTNSSGTVYSPLYPNVQSTSWTATIPEVTFTAPTTTGPLDFQLTAYSNGVTYSGFFKTDTVTINVEALTPAQAITALIGQVQALNLTGGLENALKSKLDGALVKINAGQTQTAINKLQAFINLSQALENNAITSVQSQLLTNAAMAIIDQLGG